MEVFGDRNLMFLMAILFLLHVLQMMNRSRCEC